MKRSLRVSCKRYSRKGGKSAVGYGNYIKRIGEYCPEFGRWGKDKEHIEWSCDMNLPAFCENGSATDFWHAVDLYERANACLFMEMELAIPNELPASARKAATIQFIKKVHKLAGAPLVTSVAIHPGKVPGRNLHTHMMFCERLDDFRIERNPEQWFKRYDSRNPERGGCRKIDFFTRKNIYALRNAWEKICNDLLKQHDLNIKVSCKSYRRRGIDQIPKAYIWKEATDKKSLSMHFWKKAVSVNESIDLIHEMEKELLTCQERLKEIKKKSTVELPLQKNIHSEISQKTPDCQIVISSQKKDRFPEQTNNKSTRSRSKELEQCYAAYKDFIKSNLTVGRARKRFFVELDTAFLITYSDEKNFSAETMIKVIKAKSKGIEMSNSEDEYMSVVNDKLKDASKVGRKQYLYSFKKKKTRVNSNPNIS